MKINNDFKEKTEQAEKLKKYSDKLKRKKPVLDPNEPMGKINKSKKDY